MEDDGLVGVDIAVDFGGTSGDEVAAICRREAGAVVSVACVARSDAHELLEIQISRSEISGKAV